MCAPLLTGQEGWGLVSAGPDDSQALVMVTSISDVVERSLSGVM